MTEVQGLAEVLASDGWPYASALPVDAEDPGRFHALFGRDSLITSLQLLPVRPDVASATLRALAARQGARDDAVLDEEPGKIVHEVRSGMAILGLPSPAPGEELRYYGSADSTPWFLVVLAAAGDRALADELEPAWRAAGDWVLGAVRRGGGLLRWGPRQAPGGLTQQGWRDAAESAFDPATRGQGIVGPDGEPPVAPVADADTQAVAAVGLRALHALSGEAAHDAAARALERRVRERFGPETMAVDGQDRDVPGAGSQLGWLLWAGCAGPGVAERLVRPDVLTPFGLRTLSDGHPAFDPSSYHRGSVWPFDSWLGWGGLRAAGRADDAERVRSGVLAAMDALGRFPELYAVSGGAAPRPIAFANRLQAWSVGARWALEHDWDGRVAALCAPRERG
jgi:glycogen debranching enzyme